MGNLFSQPSEKQSVQMAEEILSKLPPGRNDLPLIVLDSAELDNGTYYMDVLMHKHDKISTLGRLDILAKTEINHSVQRLELSAASAKLVKGIYSSPEETARRKNYMEYLAKIQEHKGDIMKLRDIATLLGVQIDVDELCQDGKE